MRSWKCVSDLATPARCDADAIVITHSGVIFISATVSEECALDCFCTAVCALTQSHRVAQVLALLNSIENDDERQKIGLAVAEV
eukprot:3194722-Rhodomonas_salina.5